MLRFLFHIILALLIFLNAQVSIVNRSLIDSSLSVAYLGVENTIELIGLKNNKEPVLFSATNGAMTAIGQNQYLLRPLKTGECTINFQTRKQKLATKTFRIDTLTELRARLAGVRDSFATVQEIIRNPLLVLEFPKTYYKHNFYIRSFVLLMDPLGFEDIKSL